MLNAFRVMIDLSDRVMFRVLSVVDWMYDQRGAAASGEFDDQLATRRMAAVAVGVTNQIKNVQIAI